MMRIEINHDYIAELLSEKFNVKMKWACCEAGKGCDCETCNMFFIEDKESFNG